MKKIILLCIVFAWVGQTFAQSSDWFPPSAPPTGNQINDLDFVDDSTGWAVGYNGIILKTTDGGASWTTQKIGAGMIYYDAFFIDSSNGWVIGRIDLLGYVPLIYITTDGGESWRIRQTGASTALYSISFVNHSEGWAVGCEIRKTTDGGESWTGQSSGATNCLKSVYFLDNQIGWIVGKGGNILKTTNGGDSWDVCASPTSEDLNSVYFVDGQRGCAVGNWGTIITTSDGGATWFNSETGLSNYLSSVTFFDALTGWAAGEDGLIIKTTDGGTTWKAQSSAISTDLKSIYFINSNTGWTAGAYGKILKTTNGGGEVTFTSPILQSPADESPDISINPTLYWNSVSGATSYRIQVSTISVFSSTVFDIDGITATSYQLNDLISDSTYYWRVAANYGEYGEGPIIWSTIWSFKTLTTPPFPPTLLLPEDREDAQPTTLILYWQEIYLAESYHLQVSTDP
ncbi:MAG: hypothetical protein KAW56_14610, partial [Candidatus Marinimicrobia bacterium]|nr:hypothetical protein [Candidatus Neomarinimicrobiota bacterium]